MIGRIYNHEPTTRVFYMCKGGATRWTENWRKDRERCTSRMECLCLNRVFLASIQRTLLSLIICLVLYRLFMIQLHAQSTQKKTVKAVHRRGNVFHMHVDSGSNNGILPDPIPTRSMLPLTALRYFIFVLSNALDTVLTDDCCESVFPGHRMPL